jgi:hypothetical protein
MVNRSLHEKSKYPNSSQCPTIPAASKTRLNLLRMEFHAVVKQEVIHIDVSEAENRMTNVSTISRAPMLLNQKIKNSPAQKRKESTRIQGTEKKEYTPAKVAHHSMIQVAQVCVSDSDDDLVPKLLQVKRQ